MVRRAATLVTTMMQTPQSRVSYLCEQRTRLVLVVMPDYEFCLSLGVGATLRYSGP